MQQRCVCVQFLLPVYTGKLPYNTKCLLFWTPWHFPSPSSYPGFTYTNVALANFPMFVCSGTFALLILFIPIHITHGVKKGQIAWLPLRMLGLLKQGERGDSKARDGGEASSRAKASHLPPPTNIHTANNTDDFQFSPFFQRYKLSTKMFYL